MEHAECSICFDALISKTCCILKTNNLRTCRHFYHEDCIKDCMKTSHLCPVCRRDFDSLDVLADPRVEPFDWFTIMDQDHGGTLDQHELTDGLKATINMDFRRVEGDIERLWPQWTAGTEDGGVVTFDTFLNVVLPYILKHYPGAEALEAANHEDGIGGAEMEAWQALDGDLGEGDLDLAAALADSIFVEGEDLDLAAAIAESRSIFSLSSASAKVEDQSLSRLSSGVMAGLPSIRRAREWFQYWDDDNSGQLDKQEVLRALVKTFRIGPDASGAGAGAGAGARRDFDELSRMRVLGIASMLDSIWPIFDADNSGSIDIDEFTSTDGLCDTLLATMQHEGLYIPD